MSTTVHPDMTLAEIVTSDPGSARLLEARHLDYCCGGQQTLSAACTEAGLDPDEVLAELADRVESPPPDWREMDPAALVDHLESTHHAYLHAELPRLVALGQKVAEVHGTRHPELVEVAALVRAVRDDLEPHLAKEEQVLFPMIRELAAGDGVPSFHCGSLANPIRVMLGEHDRTGELLEAVRRTTDDYALPDDACASYTALFDGLRELEHDTHLHVHKENNVLFPAVLALEHERSA